MILKEMVEYPLAKVTRSFYKQHFYKQCQAETGRKSSKC